MPDDSNNNEGFVSRWSRRKQQVAKEELEQDLSSTDKVVAELEEVVDPELLKAEKLEALNKLTDEDMPDIETLDESSDFSAFMSTSVTEGLRKMALKKLFMGASFNIRDGLDEYDDDYTKFEKMPDTMVTSDMKHMIEVEAKKQLAKEKEEERQRMIAAGELDEFEEIDEFDEFADEEDDDEEVIAEEYVDEHVNVDGFDTSATDENRSESLSGLDNNFENDINNSDIDNQDEEVA